MVDHITSSLNFDDFLTNGGEYSFEIDESDIDQVDTIERHESIKASIDANEEFIIPPSSTALDAKTQAETIFYGDKWGKIILRIHNKGGTIFYKKQPAGRFMARCQIPFSPE